MSSPPSQTPARKSLIRDVPDIHVLWAMSLVALVLALVGPLLSASNQTRQRSRFLADHALETLGEDAMLSPQSSRLSVKLVPQAGELADLVGVKQAVARSELFQEVDEAPNLILVAPHRWGPIHAMELRLVRKGWGLRLSEMQYLVHVPWAGPLAMLVACIFLVQGSSAYWLIMPVAAGTAQAILAWCKRGTPWQEVPVTWSQWPETMYAKLDQDWLGLVFARPYMSVLAAALLLGAAYLLSSKARASQRSRSAPELWAGLLWVVASVAWWDANFRSCMPFDRISFSGSGWMRISWALRGLAWAASGFLIFRRAKAQPMGQVLTFPSRASSSNEASPQTRKVA